MMLCSEVAMTDAEKENEARYKAMLNELISVVKKQTMEMEDLAERMDELAVDLKAIVKPLGAPIQALPPLVPAPTATLVAAVVHAVAAATPRAEAAHAPESPTKCSTSGPDPNAGYAKVAAVSLLSRGATTARRALAEPVNVSSSKSFNTGELDTVTPTRCSTACRGCNIDLPPTCPQKVAPTPPSADAMLDAAVIALVHSTSKIAVDKDGNTDTLEHAAMGQVEAALASNGHDNLWINYNIRFPDFSSCVFAALVVPAMEVFGKMGDKNKREQYFVDMVWEQWLEPWPPPHRHGNLLELFHKQAGIRSWRTTFANAEMGVLNLLVHGVILVEQLLLPYWDYGKFQSLFWVQLKSYSNTHCHGCVELMVGLVGAEQGVEAMGPFQLVISSGIGFDVVSLSEFFIVYAEVKGYFQGLQVYSSNPNYEMESKEQKPTHRRNESVDLTSSKVPAETIEAKMVSERPADDENEVVENGIINGSLKSFSMSDKEQGVANAGGNARLIGRSETGERGISSRCRPSTSSDENSCSSISSISKPHKANDSRWEVIQMIRTRDGILGPSHFKLLKKLGCGDIGSMYLSELSGTKSYFAMKVMDKASLASRKKFLRAQTEKEILQCLDHPFLPTLYTHLETDKFSCLVMEFCLGEDLHTLRQRKHGKYFPEQAVKSYVAEILLALEYLHMLGIIYRDLKPENVFVCEDRHIMLSDFDLSLRCVVSPTLIRSSNPDTKALRKNS